jgi:hypothetical protein
MEVSVPVDTGAKPATVGDLPAAMPGEADKHAEESATHIQRRAGNVT